MVPTLSGYGLTKAVNVSLIHHAGSAQAEVVTGAQDPSLPKGHAIWIATRDMPAGLYYVTDDREDADGWADAMHLAVHLMSRQQLSELGSVLQPDTATSRRSTATQ